MSGRFTVDQNERRILAECQELVDTGEAELAEVLAPPEQQRLAELEAFVERGLQTFVEVGLALSEIRESRLYRETYDTFEAYCEQRWGFVDSRARQLIAASETVTTVTAAGLPAPASERQARELAPLRQDEPQLVETWRELRSEYGDEVTAVKVKRVVKNRLERKRRETQRRQEQAELRSRYVDEFGGELVSEEYVTYSTPRLELLEDVERLNDGIEKLENFIAQVLPRQVAEMFHLDWTPHISIGDAVRGRRAATAPPKQAADLLPRSQTRPLRHPGGR